MNRLWLIGASEGIGRALAKLLSSQGYQLALSARNADRLQELIQELGQPHLNIPLDVGDSLTIEQGWQQIQQQWQGIDTIVYCAGYYQPVSADAINLSEIEKMVDINLTGAFRVLTVAIPYFIQQQRGHVALVGSVAGYRGLPGAMGYGASKAGIIHLAENLVCDLSKYHIRVQVINPGFVKTRLTDLNDFPMPFLLSPEQAARSIAKALRQKKFEHQFPWFFATCLKFMRYLPAALYFSLVKKK